MNVKANQLIKPQWGDPRLLIVGFLSCYIAFALYTPSYTRSWQQLFAAVGSCLLVDFLFLKFYKKLPLVPLSGLVTSLGLFLLVNSSEVWPYAFVAALSIASKHFIQLKEKHLFNPNNFGLVVALFLFGHTMTVEAANWGGYPKVTLIIFLIGSFIAHRVNRHWLVFSYVIGFLVLGLVRSFIGDVPLSFTYLPVFGPAFQLFIFYMISDPRTSPQSSRPQVFFGLSLAIVDAIFRFMQLKYAPFYALFLMAPLFRVLITKKERPHYAR